jgi:two-component system chemotaxis sensor kinase CheA
MQEREMEEIVREFLVESHEGLDQLDRDLVTLEQSPTDQELLNRIFRCVHTVKGTCGFLGFEKLEQISHVGENVLSRLREGSLGFSPDLITVLLRLVDAIRDILTHIERSGTEGETDYAPLAADLSRFTQGVSVEGSSAPASALSSTPLPPPPADAPLGQMLVDSGDAHLADVTAALTEQTEGDPRRVGEILVERGAVESGAVSEALQAQRESRGGVSDTSIRVDVSLLDKLMDLVGELVLARNQLIQFSTNLEDAGFTATTQRLNLVTTELQEGVMKTRMQPIGNIWSKFPRVVRDLASSCGKQIRLEMEGKDTELDKTIIEAIKDPLTHLVRNSVDHGVEKPEVRVARGKEAEGRIFLRAYHEGGQVNIEMSDDGGGIDPAKIRQQAVQRGLVSAELAARMSERDSLGLIFQPGLSTAAQVTNVSGRGVGMDVVKTNIEKIGGTVDVQSRVGIGTTIRIKIPLTLAIIPALVVASGGDRYAIPQVSLLELVRLEGEQAERSVELIQGAPVYRLRGNLLPLVHLDRELSGATAPGATAASEPVNIVVLQAEDRQFGLVVEGICDTEEIVVKPLSKQLKGITAFAGATIMGDGRVALILDVLGIAQQAGVVSGIRDRSLMEKADTTKTDRTTGAGQSLLLCAGRDEARIAVPLSTVARLEEFAQSAVEWTGAVPVVQYRGQIMALAHPQSSEERRWRRVARRGPAAGEGGRVSVVVLRHNNRTIGLVVERILDIVSEPAALDRSAARPGVLGCLIIQDRITELLDVDRLAAVTVDREAVEEFEDSEETRLETVGAA